jgi:glutamyl endopeptidase
MWMRTSAQFLLFKIMNQTARRLEAIFVGVCLTSIPVLANNPAFAQSSEPSYPKTALPQSDPRSKLDPQLLNTKPIPIPARRQQRTLPTSNRGVGFHLKTKKITVDSVSTPSSRSVPSETQNVETGNPGSDRGSQVTPPPLRTVFGPDNRVRITNTTTYPWRAFTKVYMTFPNRQVFVCSGTLIAAKYVLTAGHCIYNAAAGGWPTRVEVIPGLRGNYKPYGSAFGTYYRTYVAWTNNRDPNHDIALVTLDRSIGNTTGWLGYGSFPRLNGTLGRLSGYPGDLSRGLYLYSDSDPVSSSTTNLVFYRIDMKGGQSGSGVYNSNRQIFAVNAYESRTINFGTRINTAKFRDIQSWIRSGT